MNRVDIPIQFNSIGIEREKERKIENYYYDISTHAHKPYRHHERTFTFNLCKLCLLLLFRFCCAFVLSFHVMHWVYIYVFLI